MLEASTFKFLKDLKKNNNKGWFDAHRPAYEAARANFADFIQALIDGQGKKDKSIQSLVAKNCMFRINRDIRFSKDKTPYKTNFGASMAIGGKKSIYAGYYFHCSPGDSFVGGGLWMPMPAELKNIRQEIDYSFDEFRQIIQSKKFKQVYGELYRGEDASLKKIPAGYEKDNPAETYLRLKSFLAMRPITDAELTSKTLLKTSLHALEALYPLLQFLNRAIGQ